MRKILLVCLLCFLTILVACSPSEAPLRLGQVLNIKVHKNVLTFDPVLNADSYILNINSLNVSITSTSYTFETRGDYKVLVKAVGEGYLDSLFSETISFEVKFLDYPSDISIINRQLNFTQIADATSYNVEINDVVYNTKTSLLPTFVDGTYRIRIQAISDLYVDSNYSPIVVINVDSNDQIYSLNSYTYSLHSLKDLHLYAYQEDRIGNILLERLSGDVITYEVVDSDYIYILEGSIYLKHDYLDLLAEYTTVKFRLTSSLGYHDISVKINNEIKPYVNSDILVQTNFIDDVVFRFEVYNTKFVSVSGHMITSEYYHFINDILVIDVDFIKKTFESDLTLDQMLLSYRFEENEMVYIGFIIIKR